MNNSETPQRQKYSSSLKEKLKKSGRCHFSPLADSTMTERKSFKSPLCCIDSQRKQNHENIKEMSSSERKEMECLLHERNSFKLMLDKKEDDLRKLKMVKMYRSKNDLKDLKELTFKWKKVCQYSLEDLYSKLPLPKPSKFEFLSRLHIDSELVGFDEDNQSFI